MWVTILKSKLNKCRITGLRLHYEGSIRIDKKLLEAANLLNGELVHVLNLNNGSRIETYVIEGPPDSGIVELNGPAARTSLIGDEVIILAYALMEFEKAKEFKPRIVSIDPTTNKITGFIE